MNYSILKKFLIASVMFTAYGSDVAFSMEEYNDSNNNMGRNKYVMNIRHNNQNNVRNDKFMKKIFVGNSQTQNNINALQNNMRKILALAIKDDIKDPNLIKTLGISNSAAEEMSSVPDLVQLAINNSKYQLFNELQSNNDNGDDSINFFAMFDVIKKITEYYGDQCGPLINNIRKNSNPIAQFLDILLCAAYGISDTNFNELKDNTLEDYAVNGGSGNILSVLSDIIKFSNVTINEENRKIINSVLRLNDNNGFHLSENYKIYIPTERDSISDDNNQYFNTYFTEQKAIVYNFINKLGGKLHFIISSSDCAQLLFHNIFTEEYKNKIDEFVTQNKKEFYSLADLCIEVYKYLHPTEFGNLGEKITVNDKKQDISFDKMSPEEFVANVKEGKNQYLKYENGKVAVRKQHRTCYAELKKYNDMQAKLNNQMK